MADLMSEGDVRDFGRHYRAVVFKSDDTGV